jgi:hypothetical protein
MQCLKVARREEEAAEQAIWKSPMFNSNINFSTGYALFTGIVSVK